MHDADQPMPEQVRGLIADADVSIDIEYSVVSMPAIDEPP